MLTLIDLINFNLAVESGHIELIDDDGMHCPEGPPCETCPFTDPCDQGLYRRGLTHLPEYLLPLSELRSLYPEYFI